MRTPSSGWPGPPPAVNDWTAADCFVWPPARQHLQPVPRPNRVALTLIRGVDHVRDILHENTVRFADGFAGQQRAAVGRARHGQVVAGQGRARRCAAATSGVSLKLVEVHREDIATLPALIDLLQGRAAPLHRVLRRSFLRP